MRMDARSSYFPEMEIERRKSDTLGPGTTRYVAKLPLHQSDDPLSLNSYQGSGKSVTATYLREYFEKKGTEVVLHRFHHTASVKDSTPTTFAASLILQLLERHENAPFPDALNNLESLVAQYPADPKDCPFDKLWTIVVSLLSAQAAPIIVIDALDECTFENKSSPNITSLIDVLLEALRARDTKAIIFSRPEPQFSTPLHTALSIFMGETLVASDVDAFSMQEYQRLDGLPGDVTSMQRALARIRSSSHGNFRWAGLFLDYLARSIQADDFNTRLEACPPSIHDFYEQALKESTAKLDKDEKKCRNAILMCAFRAQRILRMTEISSALSLRPDKAEQLIYRLCKPLISTREGILQWSHPSVLDFLENHDDLSGVGLPIGSMKSHEFLLQKCLSILMEEKYGQLDHIGRYLELNHMEDSTDAAADDTAEHESFYNYASKYWDYHLFQIEKPSQAIVKQLQDFLSTLQFTHWAEYSRVDLGQYVGVVGVYWRLVPWHQQLPKDCKRLLDLEKFAETPYSRLAMTYEAEQDSSLLPWLARMSLGDIYCIIGLADKEKPIRELLVTELGRHLGSNHRVSLRATANLGYVRLQDGKMRAALRMYSGVGQIQRDLLGRFNPEYLLTMIYVGQSQYYMADFEEAAVTFTWLSANFLRSTGSESWQYQSVQSWYGKTLTHLDQLDMAFKVLQTVVLKRIEMYGPQDTFASFPQIAMAEVSGLLGRKQESISTLEDCIVWRRKSYPMSSIYRFDVELALARAYHDADLDEKASDIIIKLERTLLFKPDFARLCQVTHLKANIIYKEGCMDQAIDLLQDIIYQAEEDQCNRALLWVRLDLASMLRQRGNEYDEDQASSNFHNLLTDVSGDFEPGFSDQPDPPRILQETEKALKLLRARKPAEARELLKSSELEWRIPSELWLWVAGNHVQDI